VLDRPFWTCVESSARTRSSQAFVLRISCTHEIQMQNRLKVSIETYVAIALTHGLFAAALFLPCLLMSWPPLAWNEKTPGWICLLGSFQPWAQLFRVSVSLEVWQYVAIACHLSHLPSNACVIAWPIALGPTFRCLVWPIRLTLVLGSLTSLTVVLQSFPKPFQASEGVLVGCYFWVGSIYASAFASFFILRQTMTER
jgi:hypothetical protein